MEAAVEGDTNAQFELAGIYEEEASEYDMFEPDMELLKKAVHWYEKAAEKGHTPSQHALLGIYIYPYDDASPPEWPGKWLPLVKEMAAKGDRKAQYHLAGYYSFPHNCDTQFKGCLNKAISLYSGLLKDLPPGETTVFKPFEITTKKITRQKIDAEIARLKAMDPEAEEKLSRMNSLLTSARNSGSLKDLVDLGDMWANPNSPDKNINMAMKAYTYAAEKNHAEALVKLAQLNFERAEDMRDYQEAYFLALAAAMGEEPTAPALLSKIAGKLPPGDLPAMEAAMKKEIHEMWGE
ncbi:hypothetical protein DSLASN_47080 [Desulfoluna limicola]|uniref:Sel1 repeat family protein n=1 Tax=Desulfoluna limicola TaxID=2810562 RepID=A0ABM7PPM4_9BACT|nr:hypothetical protein DSLASN_47080 [Desulfoluna limicola]